VIENIVEYLFKYFQRSWIDNPTIILYQVGESYMSII